MNCSSYCHAEATPVDDTQSFVRPSRRQRIRHAFTLVELLVVIAIIGILVGMLSVAVGPAITRAREAAVVTEMKQMELKLEDFKTQNGFYPPTFSAFNRNPNMEAQLLPFLNKLSPNHSEGEAMPGAPVSRLRYWWNNVGRHLDDSSSLVFWLSGLSKNKQYPVTFGLPADTSGNPQLMVAYNANLTTANNKPVNSTGGEISPERESAYDFRGGQLLTGLNGDSQRSFVTPLNPESDDYATTTTALQPGVAVYTQAYGDQSGVLTFFYRHAGFYNGGTPNNDLDDAYHTGSIAGNNLEYVNPASFQLISYGMDGKAFPSSLNNLTGTNRDNLTNFANGRLEVYVAQ